MTFYYKIKSLTLFLVIIAFNLTFSRIQTENYSFGLPIIRNFLPKEYKAHNQNWAITSDNRGIMFFGNSSGLLEFDGSKWNLIKIPNGLVRSLDTDKNGTVFVGSVDDIGYIHFNKNGSLVFKSLSHLINIGEQIGQVWHTYAIDSSVYFFTNKRIFQFTFQNSFYDNPKLKILLPSERFRVAHKYNNRLYVVDAKEGLQVYNGEGFSNIKGGEIFADDNIYSILPFTDDGKEILIISRSKGLFIYDGQSFKAFKTEFDEFIKQNRIYFPGAKLPDGTFVVGTISSGAIIFYKDGKLLQKIDTKSGLPDNGVLFIKYINNKLWFALQNGISMIDLPSPIRYFNQNSGLNGSVSDLKVFNKNVYAATTSGLFKLNLTGSVKDENTFARLKNVSQEGWSIISYNNTMVAATTNAVGLIVGDEFKPITSSWRGCYYLYHSKHFPNRIYVGLENGVGVLEEVNGNWKDLGQIPGINTAVRNIEEDKYGNLWLGTPYSAVYRISNLSANSISQSQIINYKNESILGSGEVKVFKINDEIVFTTENKILLFNEQKKLFEEEKGKGFNDYFKGSQVIHILEDKTKNLWISSVKNYSELSITFASVDSHGKYKFLDLSFLKSIIDFSNSNAVTSIFKDEDSGLIWFCGADGIVNFNSKYLQNIFINQKQTNPLIRKITLKGDSVIFFGDDKIKNEVGFQEEFSFPFDFNSVRFDFSSLNYDDNLSQYQYKLDGYDNEWSAWTSENKKDYTNLSAGKYVFRVRSKNIFNTISNESTFSFSVLAPWYLSWYAFFIYFISLALIIYLTFRFRLNYLTKKNLKLEAIIEDRTQTIKQQKEKLQQLDEIKSRFFTNISHEFRTPLTLILGQIESVMNSSYDLSLKKKLGMSFLNAKKLLRMINQILEISKIESGGQQLKLVKKNIVSFTRHILYNFESIADQKGISLEFFSDQENVPLYFDPGKIDKVLTNLIGNSIKFTPEGGKISVRINQSKELSVDEKDTLEIIIEDTGIGIPEDRLPYIFDRFYQADRIDRTEIEGTGIGLTLTKELVELHSGKIEVKSQVGKGTLVKITLPLLKEENPVEEKFEVEANEESDNEYFTISQDGFQSDFSTDKKEVSDKESILIIDDNSDLRQFIREQLEENYIIYEAEDGLTGFEKANDLIPSLIITDVRMPGIDGFELSTRIKESTLTSHIPIIILTAKADQEDKLTGLKTGADEYLIKPFSSQELVLRVKNLISIRKKLREKYSKTGSFNPSQVTESSLDQKLLSKILEEINNNISDENFTAEILAKNVAISVSQLNRKLNALIGQPAGQLIRTVRMEKAAKMLTNKEASIKEVAYSLGYSDQSNFARTFKKHFGKTPGKILPK